MNESRDYHTNLSGKERQTPYDITYMQNLKKKKDTNEPIYKTEIYSQTQKTNLWLPKGKGVGRDKLGIWYQQILTTVYKIDNQQGPTIQHRELYSISCNNL